MKRLILILICAAMCMGMLSGCGQKPAVHEPTGDGLSWGDDYTGPAYTRPDEEQQLILTYYPQITMNPYTCTDFTNRALFSLLYQSLFVTDRDYKVEPMLCKHYSVSEDMKTYVFYLENAAFSDGTVITPEDVVASLNAAKESDYYGGRFTYVREMAVSSDGGVTIQLSTPYENFPLLLDIPIVQAEQVAEDYPLGTGPYTLKLSAAAIENLKKPEPQPEPTGDGQQAENTTVPETTVLPETTEVTETAGTTDTTEGSAADQTALVRNPNWWCKSDMVITAETIPLMEAESITQIRDSFEFRGLSLVCANPGSDKYADYRCDYELWDCENGSFMYVTTCKASKVFEVPEIRQALTYAIDREYLVDTLYRGFARAATLPASPVSPYYNQTLAEKYTYDSMKFAEAVKNAGMRDEEIVVLVNSDDSMRVRAARAIGDMLEDCGLKVKMLEISGNDYQVTLRSWNYDLLVGQTKLSPNMDLSPFFSENGVLSWGNVNDPTIYALCLQALENHGNYYTLHQTVMEKSALVPVLFSSYSVFATRGLVTGLKPSRDNVFYYSRGKTMEEALIPMAPPETTGPNEPEE